jgi:hypothetical protein
MGPYFPIGQKSIHVGVPSPWPYWTWWWIPVASLRQMVHQNLFPPVEWRGMTNLRNDNNQNPDRPQATQLREGTFCRTPHAGRCMKSFASTEDTPPRSDSKGRYPKVCKYPNRKTADMFWPDDDYMEVCSWWSFCEIWKEHCSNTIIYVYSI